MILWGSEEEGPYSSLQSPWPAGEAAPRTGLSGPAVLGEQGDSHTHGRTRWTLETRESSVTLHASVAVFTSLTFVTAGTLRALEEEEESPC